MKKHAKNQEEETNEKIREAAAKKDSCENVRIATGGKEVGGGEAE
jgi:hypothetical protein